MKKKKNNELRNAIARDLGARLDMVEVLSVDKIGENAEKVIVSWKGYRYSVYRMNGATKIIERVISA